MNDQDYYNRNPAEDVIEYNTPYTLLIDKEEGINDSDYREASKHFTRIMTLALSFILEGDHNEIQNRLLGVVFALELNDLVDGKSQRELAREIGLSHGTISRNTVAFKKIANI